MFCPTSDRLATIPGVGPITASALAASVADATAFRSGRDLAAWLGLVPRQNCSGGKERLGSISKQGDRYLRRLLVLGATAAPGRPACRPGARAGSSPWRWPTRWRAPPGLSSSATRHFEHQRLNPPVEHQRLHPPEPDPTGPGRRTGRRPPTPSPRWADTELKARWPPIRRRFFKPTGWCSVSRDQGTGRLSAPRTPILRGGRSRNPSSFFADTCSQLVGVTVHPGDIRDWDGAGGTLTSIRSFSPLLRYLFADSAYHGGKLCDAMAKRGCRTIERMCFKSDS